MNLNWQHCKERPRVVCLCGSTKFREAFEKAQLEETLAGRIVLTVGGYPHHDGGAVKAAVYGGNGQVKGALDELHFRKIDLADEILVLNVDGYVGQSTQREIAYAWATEKRIRFLDADAGETMQHERAEELAAQVTSFRCGVIP